MSSKLPPRSLNVRKCVEQEATISGRIPVELLSRVDALSSAESTEIDVSLQFCRDEADRWQLLSRVEGRVAVECQRCLQPVILAISEHSDLRVVLHDEQARGLNAEHDTLALPDAELDVFAFVEDEILLGLPIVSMHEPGECRAEQVDRGDESARSAESLDEGTEVNPFQILATLKSKDVN